MVYKLVNGVAPDNLNLLTVAASPVSPICYPSLALTTRETVSVTLK